MNAEFSDALNQLPHGKSFRFVDAVTALEAGQSAVGIYRVRGDESFLEGHFPGNPMLPGVILIESIAQLGGIVAQTDPGVAALGDLRLTAVRAAKILGAAVPGDELEIRANIEGRMDGLVQLSGEVRRGGEILASARVTLSGTPA